MSENPGFRFKDNKLYAFSEGGVMILEAWPALKALRKEGRDAWEEFDPRSLAVLRPPRWEAGASLKSRHFTSPPFAQFAV